jgi:cytoskeletal protein RodZ
MGPFEWLAGRWTPEFEYRDRLADEVEDIAYESTRIGTRRGFLLGVLVGAILAVIAVGALMANGLQTRFFPTTEQHESHQQVTTPQPSAEELNLLKQENEQLKRELATAKAAGAASPREKRTGETQPPQPKADAPVAFPPREKRVVETVPPEPKTEVPGPGPAKPVARETAAKPEKRVKARDSLVAQPIPSNCRQEGDCDSVGR